MYGIDARKIFTPFMTEIQECKDLISKTIADRKANDKVTLESMKESMDKIQKVILRILALAAIAAAEAITTLISVRKVCFHSLQCLPIVL